MRTPNPPTWLDTTAKAYWRRIAPVVDSLGKLDNASIDLLATGCDAYSVYRAAVAKLREEGRVITTASGTVKVNPYLAVEKQAFEMLCRVWRELDLRGKPPVVESDELEQFLEGNK